MVFQDRTAPSTPPAYPVACQMLDKYPSYRNPYFSRYARTISAIWSPKPIPGQPHVLYFEKHQKNLIQDRFGTTGRPRMGVKRRTFCPLECWVLCHIGTNRMNLEHHGVQILISHYYLFDCLMEGGITLYLNILRYN